MYRFGPAFVIGAALLLIGASIVVDALFDIRFPLVRSAIAIGCIAAGSRMIVHALARRRAVS
jgi:hypothetical protein